MRLKDYLLVITKAKIPIYYNNRFSKDINNLINISPNLAKLYTKQ